MKKLSGIKSGARMLCAVAAFLFVASGLPMRALAASDFTRGLVVGEYTVRRNGDRSASKIEKGDKVSVTAPAYVRGITAEEAGKITITAESDSFTLPEKSAVVETTGQEGTSLQLKVSFTDVTYRGRGNAIRFRLTYQNGATDEGSVDLEECVEEKRGRKSSDDDDKPSRKETLYGAPPLAIDSEAMPALLHPGQEFTVKVEVRNLSPRLSAFNLVVGLEPSDGVTLAETTSSRYIQSLHAMQDKYLTVRLKANKEITNPAQALSVNVKYEYIENDVRGSSSASEKLNLPFDPQLVGSTDVATPNIIISQFSYGDQIAVGDTFTLALQLKNTNAGVPIENLVMTLEPGEGFTFVDSSNTFYFPNMAAGGTLDQSVQVKALAPFSNAKPDYKIETSFKYEYLAGGKRSAVTSSERLSFPVYYPDRFEISPSVLSDAPIEGNEITISLPYVNKGKAEISNVEAALVGAVEAYEPHQNLGNFEAGKSGSIDFVIRPTQAGDTEVKIQITYEDSNMKLKTVDYPIQLAVAEAAPVLEDISEPVAPKQGISPVILGVAGGLLLLVAGVVWSRHRRTRTKKLALSERSTVWENESATGEKSDE